MKLLIFKHLMKKYSIKNNTMNESDVQRVNIYPIDPRDSKITSDRRFVNIDNGSIGGSHWTCFTIKDKKSFSFRLVWWTT